MYKRFPNITLAAVFIVLALLGAAVGVYVQHLRESEAFYRWMLATATNMRLGWEDSGEYQDDELFRTVNEKVLDRLPEVEEADVAESVENLPQLALVGAHREYDGLVWDLARSDTLDRERGNFLACARDRKLLYARDIQYAEAQASGVNIFNLFFGFRRVAANFIWLQVDRYWHQGMMYRMVPLMKTCVALDPNFVDAYLLGAWHMAYNATAKMLDTPQHLKEWSDRYQACVGPKERYYYWAIEYLKDGIRNNPRDYRLYFDLGFAIYKEKLKDYENAVKYLSFAMRQYHDRWVPRQLYICLELTGDYEKALRGWKSYVAQYPDTSTAREVAPRFIKRNEAMLFEKSAADAREAAEQTNDPAEAARLRQQAQQNKEKALEVWNSMDDPYAEARILRLQAIELAAEGNYLEAIATLDRARWEAASLFEELSDMIIDYKLESGLPLSVSEKKAVLRREHGEGCPGMPESAQAA